MATLEDEIRERLRTLTPAQQREVLDLVRSMTREPARGVGGAEGLKEIPQISPEFARELRFALAEMRRMPGQRDTLLRWAQTDGRESDFTCAPAEPPHPVDADGR